MSQIIEAPIHSRAGTGPDTCGRIVCGRRIETNAEAMHRHEFCQWAVELKASGALLGFYSLRIHVGSEARLSALALADATLAPAFDGPSRAKSASRSLRRALLIPQVNTGSLYRCGNRT